LCAELPVNARAEEDHTRDPLHVRVVGWLLVAQARNHLQANRPLGFCFEIPI